MPGKVTGKRFLQESLETNLDAVIAGHRPLTYGLLGSLMIILSLFLEFSMGCLGAFFILNVMAHSLNESVGAIAPNELVALESLIAVLIAGAGITTATLQPFRTSLLITLVFSTLLILSSFVILEQQNRLPSEFFLTAIFGALFSLAFSYICFLTIRFIDALADIVLARSLLFKATLGIAILLAGILGGLAIFSSSYQSDKEKLIGAILAALSPSQLSQVKLTLVVAGALSSLALAFSAWLANRRRNVPWNYPDRLRSLALAVGSWRGTSFHNLDLSHVSFRNARLANTDLRARNLYRTCFQGAIGLNRARVDNRYLDLENPNVQTLLTQGTSQATDYNRLNLRGAYLQGADLRRMSFIEADLSGADLKGADLRGATLARVQAIGADFSHANLTGICIQDWSVNDETNFSKVSCDYIYRELDEKGEPTDRYPAERNFEPEEFESLYQEISNVAELIFKEGVNWQALGFSMQKLDVEEEGMGLELKGVERRGDRWVVRVTHNQQLPKQEVERRLTAMYDDMKGLLVAKEQQINKLLGIASDQAEALKEISQKPFGNSFFITGSTITNLTGSGNIEYTEAAHQVRAIVTQGSDRRQLAPIVKQFAQQLKQQEVATTGTTQLELIQQLIVAEAEADSTFRAYLLKESPQILQTMAGTPLSKAIEGAIAQLR